MAENDGILSDINPDPAAGANGADNQPAAGIIAQYVKDMSVENPNAPDVYQWTEQPQIDLQLNIGANKVNDEIHEVELKVVVTAKGEQGNFYLVELSYCALAGLRNIPDEQAHAFLYAEAPRLLFPLRSPGDRRCDPRCGLRALRDGPGRFRCALPAAPRAGRAGTRCRGRCSGPRSRNRQRLTGVSGPALP